VRTVSFFNYVSLRGVFLNSRYMDHPLRSSLRPISQPYALEAEA
jgi:hypothetical protein